MTEHFGFFDAMQDSNGNYDREYNAQQFTEPFRALVTTGVMKGAYNQLEVTANGANMVSAVKSGVAFVEGRYYYNDALVELTHDTEVIGLNRIDRIVVRMDSTTDARYVKTFIKKGVPSTSPVAPTLTQTPTVYEISLAQVRVVGGQTFIASNNVTDERGKDVVCPWAGSNILPNFSDSSLGQPNGIATLDGDGNVPMVQLRNVPLPQDATTAQKGVVQLNNTLTSTATNQAATANIVKQLNDTKANKTQPYWTTGVVGSGFNGVVKYFKDEMGFVHVYFTIYKSGSIAANEVIFSLPSAFRPSDTFNTIALGTSGSSAVPVALQFQVGGNVKANYATPSGSTEGVISFRGI